MTRRFSRTATSAGVLLALAAMSGCDDAPDNTSQPQDTRFQCAIERTIDGQQVEEAVDCDQVDDNDGTTHYHGGMYPVFIHSYPAGGHPAYAPGQRLPAGGQRIGYKDPAARQTWGLPSSGRVANNTVKTSVLGKGGAPVGGKAAAPGAGKGGAAGG